MTLPVRTHRREFLRAGAGGAFGVLAVPIAINEFPQQKAKQTGEMEVSPAEDLMREHGVLDRVLLIYEEGLRRMSRPQDLPPGTIAGSASLVSRFIEDYHEKLEENYLFPRFEKAHRLTDLVQVLRLQHRAGRAVTATIRRLSTAASLKSASDRKTLANAMQHFIRMYRPHAAREDTVLFPALHEIVSPNEYASLGEEFEDQEHQLFGDDGFPKIVAQVTAIEKQLGIEDLSQFTPR